MARIIPVADQEFGHAFFMGISDTRTNDGRILWDMCCECGTPFTALGENIRSNATQSCGCLHRKRIREASLTHGLGKHPLYRVYDSIMQRCTNPKCKYYKDYGGRGITCEWQTFEEFYAAMGPSYQPGLTIERKDNNGPYSTANCRWATRQEQANNRRSNDLITYNGITQTAAEWTRQCGIPQSTLWARRYRLGWSIERALTIPVKGGGHARPQD